MKRKLETGVNETEKFKNDLLYRPASSTLEDYEKVPIQDFGAQLLKSMGWEEGKAIGRNGKGLLEPIVAKQRPLLLGLGADPLTMTKPLKAEQKVIVKPKVDIYEGDTVQVIEGKHYQKRGRVIEVKEKSQGWYVKVVTPEEEPLRLWLDQVEKIDKIPKRPRIRTRIIQKSSNYYNQSCIVLDVISKDECSCQVGSVHFTINQQYLEPIIPEVGGLVMVLDHQNKSLVGQIGRVIEKGKTVIIQMEESYELFEFNLDQISEFV